VTVDKVTLKIPRPLYERIQTLIDGSDFGSVTEFVVFVLRDLVYLGGGDSRPGAAAPASGDGSDRTEFTGEEIRALRERLRRLGYL
jgi:hypothetical protein